MAAQKLSEIEEIKSVATSTGDYMIMTEMWIRDGREPTKLITEKIGKIKGINNSKKRLRLSSHTVSNLLISFVITREGISNTTTTSPPAPRSRDSHLDGSFARGTIVRALGC